MNENIEKIYELLYSPIITPYNLLENAKLDNYEYVNYYKEEHGLVAEMKCIMDGTYNKKVFYYHFDSEDKLYQVYTKMNGKKVCIFDRKQEIENEKNKYLVSKENEPSSVI